MRITSAARTIVDVAAGMTPSRLTASFDEGIRIGAFTAVEVEAACVHSRGRPGTGLPLVNVPLLGYEVDFLWQASRIVVEMDSSHHDNLRAGTADAERDARLDMAGYRVIRVRPNRLGAALAHHLRTLVAS